MAHLELAHHFFFLPCVDVMKIRLRAHFIFVFKKNLSLDLLHLLLIATLKPTYMVQAFFLWTNSSRERRDEGMHTKRSSGYDQQIKRLTRAMI
jgi:hypothetical protein